MKNLSLLFLLILLLVSCSENNLVTPNPDSDEGVHTTLGLAVKDMQGSVNTKSTTPDPAMEKLITRLWTLQFVDGTLVKKYYTTINNAITVNDVVKADILLVPNEAGKKSNLYFVANVNKNTLANFYGTEAKFLDAVEPIVSETAILLSGNDFDQTQKCIPMFGKLENQTVTAQGLNGGIRLTLERMLARVDLFYAVGELAKSKFTLKGIRVCNVPNVMSYAPPTTATYPVTMIPSTVTSFAIEPTTAGADIPQANGNPAMKQLTFYLPENIRGNGSNTSSNLDKLKGGIPFATYYEFSGVGAEGSSYAGEEIKYKLYPGTDTKNNYDIKRNTKYILTANLANLSFSDRRVSKAGSNCYIVAPNGGTVYIPLSRVNESLLDVQIQDVYDPKCTAFIYWSTVGATSGGNVIRIDDPTCQDAQIKVTGLEKGNAVVAIKRNKADGTVDPAGKILWSWHIWVSDVDFTKVANQNTMTNTTSGVTYTFMDRNLGATELPGVLDNRFDTTAGMMYQWGRKDPFLPSRMAITNNSIATLPIVSSAEITASYVSVGANTFVTTGDAYLNRATLGTTGKFIYGNQLSYSVQSPSLFLLYWGGSTAVALVDATNGATMGADSWGGEYPTFKSVYDPCPKGWRVPSGKVKDGPWASPWQGMNKPPAPTSVANTVVAGTIELPQFITTTPTASATTATLVDNACYADWGLYGKYPATGSRNGGGGTFDNVGVNGGCWSSSVNVENGYCLYFFSGIVNDSAFTTRASGRTIRCVRE